MKTVRCVGHLKGERTSNFVEILTVWEIQEDDGGLAIKKRRKTVLSKLSAVHVIGKMEWTLNFVEILKVWEVQEDDDGVVIKGLLDAITRGEERFCKHKAQFALLVIILMIQWARLTADDWFLITVINGFTLFQ